VIDFLQKGSVEVMKVQDKGMDARFRRNRNQTVVPSRFAFLGLFSLDNTAFVPGMKPKSCGNTIPSGRTLESLNALVSGSNAYLFRLPFGVSTITSTLISIGPEEFFATVYPWRTAHLA
jgi:hypothetical protein